jgi:hypothetical protein
MDGVDMKSLGTEVLLNQFAELHIIIHNQNLIRDPLSGTVTPGLHAAQFTVSPSWLGSTELDGRLFAMCETKTLDASRFGMLCTHHPQLQSGLKLTIIHLILKRTRDNHGANQEIEVDPPLGLAIGNVRDVNLDSKSRSRLKGNFANFANAEFSRWEVMSLECWTRRSNLSKICTVGAIHNTLDHQTFCTRNISFCGGTVLCWESVTTNCPCKKVLFQRQDKNEISESSRYTYCFPNSWVAASSCVPMPLITTRSRCLCCPK